MKHFALSVIVVLLFAGCGPSKAEIDKKAREQALVNIEKAETDKAAERARLQERYTAARALLLKEEEEERRLGRELDAANVARAEEVRQAAYEKALEKAAPLMTEEEAASVASGGKITVTFAERLGFTTPDSKAPESEYDKWLADVRQMGKNCIRQYVLCRQLADAAAKRFLANPPHDSPEWKRHQEQITIVAKAKADIAAINASLEQLK